MAILVTISALVAIVGKTWDANNTPNNTRWYKKITGLGWSSIILIVFTFGVGAWKEKLIYDNSKEAEENQRIFQSTIADQNKAFKYQADKNEELLKIQVDMIEQNTKFNQSRKISIKHDEPIYLNWVAVSGFIEILRADCEIDMKLYYDKSVDIKTRLEKIFEWGEIKRSIVPSRELGGNFEGVVVLKREGAKSFGEKSKIDTRLVSNALITKEGLISLFFVGPLVFELKPVPSFKGDSCEVTYFSLT